MHRHDLLHELHVAHQPGQVVGHQLDGGDCADPAWVERRRVDVPALHQAEHLAGHPADLQRLAVELAGERVEGAHDVADGAITMITGVRRLGVVGPLQYARVGLGDHLLAVVHPDQVLLEDVVVEHVLGGLAEVDDPLAEVRRLHPVRHVLGVAGAGGVVVAADAADPAGDEVGVPRILALHEDRIAAEDRARAMALGRPYALEVDLGVDAEAADDAGDRDPRPSPPGRRQFSAILLGLGIVDVIAAASLSVAGRGILGAALPGARGAGCELGAGSYATWALGRLCAR